MSMRIKAALLIIVIVFAFTMASFLLSLSFTRQHMTDTIEQELSLALDIADTLTAAKISLLKSNAEIIAARLQSLPDDELSHAMLSQMDMFGDFISLTVYNRNGAIAYCGDQAFYDGSLPKHDNLRPVFEGQSLISSVRRGGEGSMLIISIFVPISPDRILSAAVPGMYFSSLLSEYRLWQTGSIFMVDAHGTFIASYLDDLVQNQRNLIMDAQTDSGLASAGQFYGAMIADDRGTGRYEYDGLERLCVYKHVSESSEGWYIGVTAPLRESPLTNLQNGLLFATLLLLAVGVMVSVLASGAAIKPYLTIQTQAAQLRIEHERTTLLLEAMPYSCNLWDENITIFRCNEETVRLFELDSKQEYIDNFYNFSPEYQPDGQLSVTAAQNYVRRAFQEGKCTFEWVHQKKDGTLIPVDVTLVRILYDGTYAVASYVVAAYVRDLREYKKMMAEIARRGKLLTAGTNTAAILLSTGDRIGIEDAIMRSLELVGQSVDADRVQIWRNETIDGELYFIHAYEWLSETGRLKTPVPIGLKFPYREKPEWEARFLRGECINGPLAMMPREDQIFLSGYDMKTIVIIPLFLNDKFWGFFSIDDCRQERTLTDDEINALQSTSLMMANAFSRNEMMISLRSATLQLETTLTEARRANHAKSNFLANMSHEMRTPLNAIIGLSDLILDDKNFYRKCLSHRISVQKINDAGMVLLSTVNDILDISKIEAGKLEFVNSVYGLASLINDIVTQSIMHKGEKPITFKLNIHESLFAQLCGDELRIRQIMNNLLSNAFKYTRAGTVELGINCLHEDETVWMIVTVSDTGIGIRQEDIASIFDDYMQADMKANRKIMGTGLGLSITKKVVDLMGGSINVKSEYGSGSVFTVRLPQKYVSDMTIGAKTAKNLQNFHYYAQRRKQNAGLIRIRMPYARVLIVDDVATNLDVAKGLMTPYGMQVDCVTSGQQAVDVIREEKVRYNAVFMDHMMPGMDGIEATGLIRSIGSEYARTVPIIALTANAITGSDEMFLSNGFQAFISKPIEIYRLDSVIRQWVRDPEQEKRMAPDETQDSSDASGEAPADESHEHCIAIDPEMLEGAERYGGDAEIYINVLRSFTVNIPPHIEKLKHVTRSHLADYAITVHGIKGSCRAINAAAVGDKAEALEKAAKANNFAFICTYNAGFIEAVEKLIADLSDMLSMLDADIAKPQKSRPDTEILDQLLKACKKYDMDAVDALIQDMGRYEYTQDGGLASWLRDNAEDSNFAQMIQRLSDLGK